MEATEGSGIAGVRWRRDLGGGVEEEWVLGTGDGGAGGVGSGREAKEVEGSGLWVEAGVEGAEWALWWEAMEALEAMEVGESVFGRRRWEVEVGPLGGGEGGGGAVVFGWEAKWRGGVGSLMEAMEALEAMEVGESGLWAEAIEGRGRSWAEAREVEGSGLWVEAMEGAEWVASVSAVPPTLWAPPREPPRPARGVARPFWPLFSSATPPQHPHIPSAVVILHTPAQMAPSTPREQRRKNALQGMETGAQPGVHAS
ncbi:hypothetical protein CYMTET_17544 [Cymbomonas tetramitiformis]|uniref:Uncharacterized protein n=1 Tax=Cymbomonas tetramitiformis TaxID=36881 RepID=A0AAE0GAI1_9CHLO|nr:hypothetical protein CYMTET_17544 [Cymbomonas tetramitiformis]